METAQKKKGTQKNILQKCKIIYSKSSRFGMTQIRHKKDKYYRVSPDTNGTQEGHKRDTRGTQVRHICDTNGNHLGHK